MNADLNSGLGPRGGFGTIQDNIKIVGGGRNREEKSHIGSFNALKSLANRVSPSNG